MRAPVRGTRWVRFDHFHDSVGTFHKELDGGALAARRASRWPQLWASPIRPGLQAHFDCLDHKTLQSAWLEPTIAYTINN